MSKQEEILEFINRRFKDDCNWCTGNCYYFAIILKERFNFLELYYDQILGHFVAGYDGKYYDWTGIADIDMNPTPLSKIEKEDPLLYNRIIRDCVL